MTHNDDIEVVCECGRAVPVVDHGSNPSYNWYSCVCLGCEAQLGNHDRGREAFDARVTVRVKRWEKPNT
jgi:hypothetical protein